MDRTVSGTRAAHEFVAYQVCPDSQQLERDFLCLMGSLAARSNHPLNVELLSVAKINNVLPLSVEHFQSMGDRGLGGQITIPSEHHPRAVLLGTYDLLIQCGLQIPELLESRYRQWSAERDHVVLLWGMG